MRIGFDLDEVLANTIKPLLQFHNERYGTSVTYEQMHAYQLRAAWGCTQEEEIERVYQFYQSPYFASIKPIEGAQRGVEELRKNHECIIITARQHEVEEKTRQWINDHFPNYFVEENIHFANHYARNGHSIKKGDLCDKLQIELFIEDAFHNAHECASEKRQVLLFDRPWNRNQSHPRIHRVHSWPEVVQLINNLKP